MSGHQNGQQEDVALDVPASALSELPVVDSHTNNGDVLATLDEAMAIVLCDCGRWMGKRERVRWWTVVGVVGECSQDDEDGEKRERCRCVGGAVDKLPCEWIRNS